MPRTKQESSEEKLNFKELEIFNLIRAGHSKTAIMLKKIVSSQCFNTVLSRIYKKTDCYVNYKTAKNRFEELQMFLRNNPEMFSPIPTQKDLKAQEKEKVNDMEARLREFSSAEEMIKCQMINILARIENKYNNEKLIINAKREILNDIKNEIKKGGF